MKKNIYISKNSLGLTSRSKLPQKASSEALVKCALKRAFTRIEKASSQSDYLLYDDKIMIINGDFHWQ